MSILSPDNVALLKQLLQESPLRKINPRYFDNIFTSQLNIIYENRFKYKSNLVEMNKALLSNMENHVKKYNAQNTNSLNDQYKTLKLNNHPQVEEQFTEPTENTPKITILERKFKEQKDHFDTLNNKPTPKEVDFGDNVKETIVNDGEYDMKMKQREDELNEIMQQQTNKTDTTWLKSENTLTEARKYNEEPPETKYPEPQSPKNKKVRFDMDNPREKLQSSHFFNKLKMVKEQSEERENTSNPEKSTNQQQILTNQQQILTNQQQILTNQQQILTNQQQILTTQQRVLTTQPTTNTIH
jgi:hypothetical protein